MVFYPPSWCPQLPEIPDSVPLNQFLLDESHGREPHASSQDPFTCGLSGASYSSEEVARRTQYLARSLQKELRWDINNGSELDRVICVFTSNTVRADRTGTGKYPVHNADLWQIDIMTLNLAICRCNAVSTPANVTYTADELATQLINSKAQALFTCLPLFDIALRAARSAGIPTGKVYLCEIYGQARIAEKYRSPHKYLNQLVAEGSSLPELEAQAWHRGQAMTQIAFLVYSSGTTGMPVSSFSTIHRLLCY